MSFAPKEIEKTIKEAFSDKEHPAYGQVATLNKEKIPSIRTVHFHYLHVNGGTIAFSTHVKSDKWQDLKRNPVQSGCYYDTFRNIQFRWQGKSLLVYAPDSIILPTLWKRIRKEVRIAYWLDAKKRKLNDPHISDIDPEKQSPNCGAVLCKPSRWDIYEINPHDYRRGKRSLYIAKQNKWICQEVSILRGHK